jgi:hypothetical protein
MNKTICCFINDFLNYFKDIILEDANGHDLLMLEMEDVVAGILMVVMGVLVKFCWPCTIMRRKDRRATAAGNMIDGYSHNSSKSEPADPI